MCRSTSKYVRMHYRCTILYAWQGRQYELSKSSETFSILNPNFRLRRNEYIPIQTVLYYIPITGFGESAMLK